MVPAVALAIGVGALYSLGWEYIVFGSAADHVARFLGAGGGWSGARNLDYSYPQALEKRGDIEGAMEVYKEAIRMNRRDPEPYLRLAEVRTRAGLHEEALDVLRRALGVARFSPLAEALAVREIHEIASARLGNSAKAAPDLVRYLEGEPGGEHGEWARRELVAIKERIREEG
jgi:tetratricopeptide (TPR) repeat protein